MDTKPTNENQTEQIPYQELSNGTVQKLVVFFEDVLLFMVFACINKEEHGK